MIPTLTSPLDLTLTPAQRAWLSGFRSGLAAARSGDRQGGAPTLTVEVLYGSQTGNSELVAEDAANALRGIGLGARLRELDAVTPEELVTMPYIVVVTSTYGEGEMPDNAELLWEALSASTAPRLEASSFAVLGLGDSGYDEFCQAGRLLDLRLEQLGATRLQDRSDCDVGEDDKAAEWIAALAVRMQALAPEATAGAAPAPAATSRRERPRWSRGAPLPARLVENRVLSGPGSDKEIRHLELDLADSGFAYQAGDALAVVPRNDPALVDLLLARCGLDGDVSCGEVSLRERMLGSWEIRTPSKDMIALLVERSPDSELAELAARTDRGALEDWLWGKDLLDLLELAAEVEIGVEDLEGALRPLQHRAYSISSSSQASPDRVHLTVAAVRHGAPRVRGGVASTFLVDRAGETEVGIFLQPNGAFRVPEDDAAPAVMIGPGTGIAPFRAFLQERAARGATGENWLLFGDRHRAHDFIYEAELEEFRRAGVLTRLELAFSRDQAEKVYVQDRMRALGAELYELLERGGHVYVCGDASRMAKDVDRALHQVVAAARGRGEDDAAGYVGDLKRDKRYVRDVY